MNIKETLIENPIIAAVTKDEDLENAIKSDANIIFVLYGSILNIGGICDQLKEAGKSVFVHIDLIEGLKGDSSGVEFIKKNAEPCGIITTKASNIRYAKSLGLYTIQRIFVVDTLSFNSGVKNIEDNNPNAVEIMPGIAGKIIESMKNRLRYPIIAGGLIETKADVIEALNHGALAVSTTKKELWDL